MVTTCLQLRSRLPVQVSLHSNTISSLSESTDDPSLTLHNNETKGLSAISLNFGSNLLLEFGVRNHHKGENFQCLRPSLRY